MPPKSFDDLGPILQEEVQKEVNEFREYVAQRSKHPPAPLRAATERVAERIKRDARARNVGDESGSYDLGYLVQVAQESIERIAETKVQEKQEELQATRRELARVREMYEAELKEEKISRVSTRKRREKWALGVFGALVLALASALIGRYVGTQAPSTPPQHIEVP